jgi:hypothetical protein
MERQLKSLGQQRLQCLANLDAGRPLLIDSFQLGRDVVMVQIDLVRPASYLKILHVVRIRDVPLERHLRPQQTGGVIRIRSIGFGIQLD